MRKHVGVYYTLHSEVISKGIAVKRKKPFKTFSSVSELQKKKKYTEFPCERVKRGVCILKGDKKKNGQCHEGSSDAEGRGAALMASRKMAR